MIGALMDNLPTRKELVFNKVRKTLYLQLTTVIRSLGGKFQNSRDREVVWGCIETLHRIETITDLLETSGRASSVWWIYCILAEVKRVSVFYKQFIADKSGDGRSTKKIRAGIARLELLRDNWDDLEIVGDLKSGYYLELKK